MVQGIGEITFEELSPELQELIKNSTGGSGGSGDNGISGLVINKAVTMSVTATEESQKVFTIPFADYNPDKCYLDIKIHSVWINPDRYVIAGNKVTFNGTVDKGVKVYFTCYYLGAPATEVTEIDASKVIVNDERMFVTKTEKEQIAKIKDPIMASDIVETTDKLFVTPAERTRIAEIPDKTTSEEALAGLDDVKYMTAKKTKEAIREFGGGSGGVTNNVFATAGVEYSYTFATAGTTFTIPEGRYNKANQTIEIYHQGLRLTPDEEYTINDAGLVTFSFEIEQDGVIQYVIQNSSYSYNDLSHLPDLTIKANKADLDILNTERGYLNTKRVADGTDFNTITENGLYWANAWVHSNIPTLANGTRLNGTLLVVKSDSSVRQTLFTNHDNNIWTRLKSRDGNWTAWTRVGATEGEAVSNPNLLVNSNFKVWQTGTVITALQNQYICDMWKTYNTGANVSKDPNGILLATNGEYGGFGQLVDVEELGIKNTNVTATFKISQAPSQPTTIAILGGNSATSLSFITSKNITGQNGTHSITGNTGDYKYIYVYIYLSPAETQEHHLKVAWIKLEVGDLSTSYSPRSYNEELLDCKRYYEVLYEGSTDYSIPIIEVEGGIFSAFEKFSVEKRVPPTISTKGTFRLVDREKKGGIISAHHRTSNVVALFGTTKNVVLGFSYGENAITDNSHWLTIDTYGDSESKIVADARIY